MIDLRTEQHIRAKLVLVVFLLLPFGVGIWTFFDPVGPGAGAMDQVEAFLTPFHRHSDLGSVEGSIREAFDILDENYGADSHRHAIAYLRRGELHLYRLDFHEAEKDLLEALERGGCNRVTEAGEIFPARPRAWQDGGLSDMYCAQGWQLLGQVMLETERVPEGLRYMRAHLASSRAAQGHGPEVLRRLQARNFAAKAEDFAKVLRDQGRAEEAAEVEAEAARVAASSPR